MRHHHRHHHPLSHGGRRTKILIRIFLTFLMTAVVIIGGLALLAHSLSPEHQLSPVLEKNAVFYLESLQQKLNGSLTPEGIRAFESDLQLSARVAGFENIADQQGLPQFKDIEEESKHSTSKVAFGRTQEYFFVELKNASPRTVWFISTKEFPRGLVFPFIGLAGFIMFILALSFLTIRWMMLPIKTVVIGVNKISAGDLKFRIHTRHRGEFQMIGEAFNRMADGLEKMIIAKEQLLRDVSHELRSPLTRVGVAVDLLQDEKLKTSIKEDLRKMDDLVSEILESYRLKESASLKKAPTDLSELIINVVDDYKTVSPGVKFAPVVSVVLEIDAMQIERVLRNLIENAVKYSKENSGPIEIALYKSRDNWFIKIKDEGQGIAEKDLAHIFEPFYRADAARSPGKSGFGLGLAIAKSIVEAHEGSLTVSSRLGEGSEFILRLPADIYD